MREWRSCTYRKGLLKKGWAPPHPTLYLRKAVYEQFGDFDERFGISADYDFMLRIFKSERLRFDYIPNVIYKMRVGGISNKKQYHIQRLLEDRTALKKNKIGITLWILFRKNYSKVKQFYIRKKELKLEARREEKEDPTLPKLTTFADVYSDNKHESKF